MTRPQYAAGLLILSTAFLASAMLDGARSLARQGYDPKTYAAQKISSAESMGKLAKETKAPADAKHTTFQNKWESMTGPDGLEESVNEWCFDNDATVPGDVWTGYSNCKNSANYWGMTEAGGKYTYGSQEVLLGDTYLTEAKLAYAAGQWAAAASAATQAHDRFQTGHYQLLPVPGLYDNAINSRDMAVEVLAGWWASVSGIVWGEF
jgi:hypothetical protein